MNNFNRYANAWIFTDILKLTTAKGKFSGTLIECMEHHAREQGAYPEIFYKDPARNFGGCCNKIDVDIIGHKISFDDDPCREPEDINPEEASKLIAIEIRAEVKDRGRPRAPRR